MRSSDLDDLLMIFGDPKVMAFFGGAISTAANGTPDAEKH